MSEEGQAGHCGDQHARVYDCQPSPNSCRSVGHLHRGAGGYRCYHAVRGDRLWGVSDEECPNDEHCREANRVEVCSVHDSLRMPLLRLNRPFHYNHVCSKTRRNPYRSIGIKKTASCNVAACQGNAVALAEGMNFMRGVN
jgi:hypothetical protein